MKHRLLRVNEIVKRELSTIIAREVTFDNVLVTIHDVDVTPDLRKGHVFVSVLGKGDPQAAIAQLEEHRTILQAELSKHVVLKDTPHLIFHLDHSVERGTRVFQILQEIEPADKGEEAEQS